MPRYIDADKLGELCDIMAEKCDGEESIWNQFRTTVEQSPTADVVEVVRCKDCFYAVPYNEIWTLPKKNNCMWCKQYEDARSLDWFCADGERRE